MQGEQEKMEGDVGWERHVERGRETERETERDRDM